MLTSFPGYQWEIGSLYIIGLVYILPSGIDQALWLSAKMMTSISWSWMALVAWLEIVDSCVKMHCLFLHVLIWVRQLHWQFHSYLLKQYHSHMGTESSEKEVTRKDDIITKLIHWYIRAITYSWLVWYIFHIKWLNGWSYFIYSSDWAPEKGLSSTNEVHSRKLYIVYLDWISLFTIISW